MQRAVCSGNEQMANMHKRYWGARKKTWSDTENFKQLKKNYTWMKMALKYGWTHLFNLLLFLGTSGFAFCVQSPQCKYYSKPHPTSYLCKHTHTSTNQPTNHLFTTERFPIPRQWMAQLFQTNLAFQFNKRFWTSSWVGCNKSWPGGLCFNNHPFSFLWSRDLWQEAEKGATIPGLMKPSYGPQCR